MLFKLGGTVSPRQYDIILPGKCPSVVMTVLLIILIGIILVCMMLDISKLAIFDKLRVRQARHWTRPELDPVKYNNNT